MSTALIVFLNVFFIGFVLVAVVGLCARSILSDTDVTTPVADGPARPRGAFQRRGHSPAPAGRRAARRPVRALDLGA